MSWNPVGYEEGRLHYNQEEGGARLVYLKQGDKRRYLVLDEQPFTLWSHEYWTRIGRGRRKKMVQPCRTRNRLDDSCIMCESDEKSVQACSFAGHLTVTAVTPVRTDNGVYCFDRQILRAKAGSQKKPGMFHVIEAIRKDVGGSLKGVILECTRQGEISEVCGDSIIFPRSTERVTDIEAYLRPRIAKYLEEVNRRLPRDKHRTVEDHLKWHPVTPFDFFKLFEPLDLKELKRRLASNSRSDDGGGGYGDDSNGRDGREGVPPPNDEDYYGGGNSSGTNGRSSGQNDSGGKPTDFVDDEVPF